MPQAAQSVERLGRNVYARLTWRVIEVVCLYLLAPVALLLSALMLGHPNHLAAVADTEIASARAGDGARAPWLASAVVDRAIRGAASVLAQLPNETGRGGGEVADGIHETLTAAFQTDYSDWYGRTLRPNLAAFLPAVLIRLQVLLLLLALSLPLLVAIWFFGQYRARVRMSRGDPLMPHRFRGWTYVTNVLFSSLLLYLGVPLAMPALWTVPVAIALLCAAICLLRSASIEM